MKQKHGAAVRNYASKLSLYCILTAATILMLFPYYWMISNSLKPYVEIFQMPPIWIPQLNLQNYVDAFFGQSGRYEHTSLLSAQLLNSVFVSLTTMIVVLAVGAPAAHCFARIKFFGSRTLLASILLTRMLPAMVVALPLFLLMRNLGLLDSSLALIITYTAFNLPFAIWILTVFFREIPIELEEASKIDGCNVFETFMRICLPLAAPSLAATAIFTFLSCWNEFLFALVLTRSPSTMTLPVGLAGLATTYEIRWGMMTAGGVVQTLPAIVFTLLVQKHIVRGLTLGAVRG